MTARGCFFWKIGPKPEDITEFDGKISNCQESSLQVFYFDIKIHPFHDVSVFDRSLPDAHLASCGCRSAKINPQIFQMGAAERMAVTNELLDCLEMSSMRK